MQHLVAYLVILIHSTPGCFKQYATFCYHYRASPIECESSSVILEMAFLQK